MNKISLYFTNAQKPDIEIYDDKGGNICIQVNDTNGFQSTISYSKEEASYLASALRMVLGQEKVLERTS